MKKLLLFLPAVLILLSSCSKKSYLERSDEDKALLDAVRKISKNPGDDEAADAIPVLYKSIQKDHLGRIGSYNSSPDIGKWDKIVGEYQKLQVAYEAIINSPQAFKLITPVSYSTQLLEASESAAAEYYKIGEDALAQQGRANARKAFNAFKKSLEFVPGYKDAESKMQQAMNRAMVIVIVYPVQDNSVFSGGPWNNIPYRMSGERLQQNLVRDMNDKNDNKYPARFYTDRDAYRDNVKPDWVVDMVLRSMDIPYPTANSSSRSVSREITTGTDTAGRPITQRVYATLQIIRSTVNATASMDVTVKDVINGKNISSNSYNENYRWEQETATYTGDRRALSSADLDLINNSQGQPPSREVILNDLYNQLYPRIRTHVSRAVEW